MIVLFILGSLIIIGVNYDMIIPAFKTIFINAFKPEAFVGGGIGYRAKIMPTTLADTTSSNTTYSFIPLQAMVSLPLLEHQHAPVIGISAGYGFAANKDTQGGICVGVDLGWNYIINGQSSLQLSLYADWQQARTNVKQVIEDKEYINHMGCNFISMGLKFAVLF